VDFDLEHLSIETLIEALVARAHLKGYSLIRSCGKKQADMGPLVAQWLTCSLSGSPEGRDRSKKIGCPFKLKISKTLEQESPTIQVIEAMHNHGASDEVKSKIEMGSIHTNDRNDYWLMTSHPRQKGKTTSDKQSMITHMFVARCKRLFAKIKSAGGEKDIQVSLYVLITNTQYSLSLCG
jgi:hypothetical protein